MTVFCTNCAARNRDEAKFCGSCGGQLFSMPNPQDPPPSVPPPSPNSNNAKAFPSPSSSAAPRPFPLVSLFRTSWRADRRVDLARPLGGSFLLIGAAMLSLAWSGRWATFFRSDYFGLTYKFALILALAVTAALGASGVLSLRGGGPAPVVAWIAAGASALGTFLMLISVVWSWQGRYVWSVSSDYFGHPFWQFIGGITATTGAVMLLLATLNPTMLRGISRDATVAIPSHSPLPPSSFTSSPPSAFRSE